MSRLFFSSGNTPLPTWPGRSASLARMRSTMAAQVAASRAPGVTSMKSALALSLIGAFLLQERLWPRRWKACHARAEDFLPRICADGADLAEARPRPSAHPGQLARNDPEKVCAGRGFGTGLGQIRAIRANPWQKLFALPALIA